MLSKERKEFKIIHVETQIQLHHVLCSENVTLVLAWPQNFPGGMSYETIRKTAETHMALFHGAVEDTEDNGEDAAPTL